jgi:hypothetical protein
MSKNIVDNPVSIYSVVYGKLKEVDEIKLNGASPEMVNSMANMLSVLSDILWQGKVMRDKKE